MAQTMVSGTVVCKQGEPAATLRELNSGTKSLEFSVRDTEYFYFKGDSKPGQFYKVQVIGKQAEILAERIERGDFIVANGQQVMREYNGRTYVDIKDARVNMPYKAKDETDVASSMF